MPRPFGDPDVRVPPGVVGMEESDELVLVFLSEERFGGGGSGTRGRFALGGCLEVEAVDAAGADARRCTLEVLAPADSARERMRAKRKGGAGESCSDTTTLGGALVLAARG